MRDSDVDRMIWSMYYAGLCSFLAHPGNKILTSSSAADVLDNYANWADSMFRRYQRRFDPNFKE